MGSAAGSTTSVALLPPTLAPSAAESGAGAAGAPQVSAETACFVFLDLQIYVLETDIYLVDFKNAGYEPIVGERKIESPGSGNSGGGTGEVAVMESVGSGQRKAEKDVTSPQPFLDLANKLVIHLAKGVA